jgi:alpha-beta hydrolase superfamily lysophospholipase
VELFTDNQAMRQYLRDDPCRLHKATARFLFVSRCLDAALTRANDAAIAVPTTLILASGDRIIDNAATREMVRRLTGGRAQVRELAGCHTLEFEDDPRPLHDAIRRSIEAGQ